tara:strand:+ start:2310 stop:2714 length:405 start_codon:yes stop_codon:yes gene_type:complete
MPFVLSLTFPNPINESIQVGDNVYYTPLTIVALNPSTANTSTVTELGKIIAITPTGPNTIIQVLDFLTLPLAPPNANPDPAYLPTVTDFIMFGKDKSVNTTSVIGYYAKVDFVNNSSEKAELFSVGSEIAESSK